MRKFLLNCFFGTVFSVGVMAGLYGIFQLNVFNAFDPLGKALSDMELTDINFSTLRDDPKVDDNIVIVNIGAELDRGGIGRQIKTLLQFEPKVIALDITFTCDNRPRTPEGCPEAFNVASNESFAEAVRLAGDRLVLAEELQQSTGLVKAKGDVAEYDSIEHTDDNLRQNAHEGFVNLITNAEHQEDLKVCRTLYPKMQVNGKTELAFSTMIAWLYDSVKTKKYLSRGNEEEIINFRGNIVDFYGASAFAGRYPVLEWDQALDTNTYSKDMIKDKIVILGFLGSTLEDRSWEDKFITPLNKNYAGKTRPDMFGVVVHANAVSMILNEDYIGQLKEWQKYALALIVCFLNVALFLTIMNKIPDWFDGLSILAQLIQIVLLSFLTTEFFALFDFKLDLTLCMAVVALIGTCFELYNNVAVKLYDRYMRKRSITKEEEEVLTH